MINEIRELVRIPSVTDSEYIEEVLDKALEISRRFGFRTKKIKNFCGYAEIGEGEEIIAILVHLDVVPAEGEWEHEPFDVTEEEGKIFGRGVFDDKGAAVCAMYAMKDILDSGEKPGRRIRIIFGTHEEEGDWEDIDYYKETEKLPICGFTPDSEFPVTYAEKGLARFDITCDCDDFTALAGGDQINIVPNHAECVLPDGRKVVKEGKAAHASKPELGVNAVTELMKELAKDEYEVAFAKLYMEVFGTYIDGRGCGLGFHSESGGSTTMNIGKIDYSEGSITLQADIRFCTDYSYNDVKTSLERKLEPLGFSVHERLHAEPVYLPPDGDVIRAMADAYADVTGDMLSEPQLVAASTYASAMDKIAAFGPLLPGRENTAHQKDEWFYIEDLYTARKIYHKALLNLSFS